MPTSLRDARFSTTRLADDRLTLLGIDINMAIHVVRNYGARNPGQRENQYWYQGETPDGRTLNVLVESPHHTIAKIIIVTEVTQGGA